MMQKELGATGVFLPEIGIGTAGYQAGPEPLRMGLEDGALFIDTAESYGTETIVREAIRGIRNRVFLATKVSPENFRRNDLQRSVDASLLHLGVDVIDLLQLHEPNPAIPIEETLGALSDMVDAGKVRFMGVSNFSIAQLQEAQKVSSRHSIVSNQVRYNIIDRTIEKKLLRYCQANRITVIAYSPLARGLGRVRDCDPRNTIESLARATGKTAAQIILNWCLCRDGVVVIPKASSSEHIIENCGASDWRLSEAQVTFLDTSIQYRQRSGLDVVLRKYTPRAVQEIGLRALKYLPKSLRRRLT